MSSGARHWAYNVVSAFRKACRNRHSHCTLAWEKRKLSALVQWATEKAEGEGIFFERWMVEKVHHFVVFKEMNHDGQVVSVAKRLAELYREKRFPKSLLSTRFRSAVETTWALHSGERLSSLYSSNIEYNIACKVVYGLMVKILAGEPCPAEKEFSFVAHAHDALTKSEGPKPAPEIPPETKKPEEENARIPLQLEFRW